MLPSPVTPPRLRRALLILAVAALPGLLPGTPSGTASAAATVPAQVDALMESSGLREQIDQLPALLQARLGRIEQHSDLSPRDRETVVRLLREAFRAETLQRKVRAFLVERAEPGPLDAVLDFLRGPTGKRMVALEIEASRPEAYRQMQDYAANLAAEPPSPERLALVRELDGAARVSEASVETAVGIGMAVVQALAAAGPAGSGLSAGQRRQARENLRARMAPRMRKVTLVSLLFTYRSVDDDTLRDYVDFYLTEAGQWYAGTLLAALHHALLEATGEAGQRIEAETAV